MFTSANLTSYLILKAACSDASFTFHGCLCIVRQKYSHTNVHTAAPLRMQELNDVEEGLLPRGSHFKRERSAVMHLEFFCEEVAFGALIQKCKSVSHGRSLKGDLFGCNLKARRNGLFQRLGE